jgi:broad specificity phosphatase PhoE
MPRLILVRHGEAAAGWTADVDPGLSERGRAQAEAMAAALAAQGPMPVVVSPLRRTRETAAPLEERWGVEARVDPAVGEIPSPVDDLAERGSWLADLFGRTWSELGSDLHEWRATVLSGLRAIEQDAVVVTHYVAINVAVGAATGSDKFVSYNPDYCSQTVVEVSDDTLTVVQLGDERTTRVS